ncbi:MAG TPA: acetyl-CoA C-acyltransferase [Kofleriaceae bacterium]|nr:acetyl-CoA C-acyltransferase [Kofleriaceae bacterium]
MTSALIVDAVRTARGKAKETGALHALRPVELVAALLDALAERNRLDLAALDDLVLGCVTQVGDQGANVARTAAAFAGLPRVSGVTINRACASGLDAIHHAALLVEAGRADLVVAGGVESMSRVPMFADQGAMFADPEVARRTDFIHMGIAADALATRADLPRAALDAYALDSHRRAADAHRRGATARSLVPVAGVARDELFREDLTAEKLAALAPAFGDLPRPAAMGVVDARHTVATSPGMCDGAALVLLASEAAARRLGLQPRARVAGGAGACVEPLVMLTGNVDATAILLARAGLEARDVDLFEINESFAAVPLHYARHFEIPRDRVAPDGGALSLGHPLGATGGYLVTALVDGLEARGGRRGVATVCGAAGVATALLIERA